MRKGLWFLPWQRWFNEVQNIVAQNRGGQQIVQRQRKHIFGSQLALLSERHMLWLCLRRILLVCRTGLVGWFTLARPDPQCLTKTAPCRLATLAPVTGKWIPESVGQDFGSPG